MEARFGNSEIVGLKSRPNSLAEESLTLLDSDKRVAKPGLEVETTTRERGFARELEKFIAGNFKKIDQNEDGFLSLTEVTLYNLRDDLNQTERKMGKFVASNYADLCRLADSGSLFEAALNPKRKSELCLTDMKVLRIASEQRSLQDALTAQKKSTVVLHYGEPLAVGIAGGAGVGNVLGLVAGPRLPLLAVGALAGGYVGYKADGYLNQDRPDDSRTSLPYSIAVGAGSGMLLSVGLASMGRLPLIAVGGLLGAYGAYKVVDYCRTNYYHPRCEKYYEKKLDLAKSILERKPD